MTNNNLAEWKEKYRVRMGLFFGLIFIWRAQPRTVLFLVPGLLLASVGLFLRQWAAGCIKKNDALARTGPYALLRHPLYAGSFLLAFGLIFASTSFNLSISKPYLDRTLFYWSFFWLMVESVYLPKVDKEEAMLKAKFPEDYDRFAAEVPRFIPKEFVLPKIKPEEFSWEIWKKNKEYFSLVGFLFLAALLIARYHYGLP